MAVSIVRDFNVSADKVVKLSDIRKRAKELYSENLGLGEKAWFYAVDKPLSVFKGLVESVKLVTNKDCKAQYQAANEDGSLGYYRDRDGAVYASVATIDHLVATVCQVRLGKAFNDKIHRLAAQAAVEAKDYSPQVDSGALRPL